MAEQTKIQWCEYTFNSWIGCSKVSPGCANCYAESDMDKRLGRVRWGPNGTRSRTSDTYWRQPLRWNCKARESGERHRVFCASLADVFEDWDGPIVSSKGQELWVVASGTGGYHTSANYPGCRLATMDDLRRDLFELIDATPYLDWLLLTKRPENIRRMVPKHRDRHDTVKNGKTNAEAWYRSNVWLLTSVENQEQADKRIPELLKCRDLSPVLGLSCEPLLEAIDLTGLDNGGGETYDCLRNEVKHSRGHKFVASDYSPIDWVIAGGESGHGARPCDAEWIRSLVDQCSSANVPCFVKQLGANHWAVDDGEFGRRRIPLEHSKGGDPNEWPVDLRVRQFPTAGTS